jgi:uncharacterized membrane protein
MLWAQARFAFKGAAEERFEVLYRARQGERELVDVFAFDAVSGEKVRGGLQTGRDQEALAGQEVTDERAEAGGARMSSWR